MTIPALGPVIVSVFSNHQRAAAGPGPGERDSTGEARLEADLGAPRSLIASRSVHCVALQTPLPGSARLLTTLCPGV